MTRKETRFRGFVVGDDDVLVERKGRIGESPPGGCDQSPLQKERLFLALRRSREIESMFSSEAEDKTYLQFLRTSMSRSELILGEGWALLYSPNDAGEDSYTVE